MDTVASKKEAEAAAEKNAETEERRHKETIDAMIHLGSGNREEQGGGGQDDKL
jgi:hypothetical protein